MASSSSSFISESSAIFIRLRNNCRYQSVSEHSFEHHENDLKRSPAAESAADREAAKYGERERALGILGDSFAQFFGEVDLLLCHDRYRRVTRLRMRAAT